MQSDYTKIIFIQNSRRRYLQQFLNRPQLVSNKLKRTKNPNKSLLYMTMIFRISSHNILFAILNDNSTYFSKESLLHTRKMYTELLL